MKKIRIIWLILAFAGLLTNVGAQSSLTVDATQQIASFKFTDAQGTDLKGEYSGVFTGAYNIGYRLVTDGGFLMNVGAGIRKAGATMVYDEMNYSWDLHYANGRLGLGYMLVNDVVSPYLSVAGYYAYMLRGFQTINNENFNIIENGSINKGDYGVAINPGVQLTISDAVSTYLEFNYLMGLKNLETDESQESKNFAYGLTLGFAISFGK